MIKPPSCVSFVVLVCSALATAGSAALTAPTGLTVSNLKATSFTLTWSAATGATGGIAGYDVYRDGVLIGATTTTRSFAVANLSPLTTCDMTVSVRDGTGAVSVPSAALEVTTLADTSAPSRPADLAATNVTTSSCTLNWTGSTDNVGVTGYTVYRSGVLLGTSVTTIFDVTGLPPDTNNNLTVRATDAAGNLSAASVALSVRTAALPPSTPAGLATTNLKTTSFTLTWAASTGGTGGIASYDVFNNGALVGPAIAGRTFVIAGLTPTTTYLMTVVARDAAGNISAASVAVEVTTPADTTAPTRPVGLVATDITTTTFVLTWGNSTDNVAVTGYNIYRSGVLLGTTPGTSYQVTGLIPDSANTIAVRAMDSAGNLSAASVALSVRMVALPPSPPTGLTVTALRPSSFTLQWTASTGGTGGIAGYDVYLNGVLVGSPTTRRLAVSGLAPQTAYSLTVTSHDPIGNVSAPSEPLVISTPADVAKPSVPKGLSADNVTATSFTLVWTASTDNVGVTGYDVYRNNQLVGSALAPSFAVTGLAPGTLSSMRVKAKDAAGNVSGFSAILPVTTSALPNTTPTITLSSPPAGSSFTLPIALALSASAADSDGTIVKVEFFDNGTYLGETAAADPAGSSTFTLLLPSGLPAGVHTLTARATDDRNATADSNPVTISVSNPNLSPTVTLTASSSGTSLIAPGFVTLAAHATDSDGVITKVEFYENEILLGAVNAPSTPPSTFTFPLTLYSAGSYTVTAVATDNSTAATTSVPIVINVNSGAATLPFVANFETAEGFHLGPLTDQLSWFATSGVAVVPSLAPGSLQELSIPAAAPAEIFSHDFSAPGISPIFVDFQANPVAGSDPASAVMFSTPAAQVALVGTSSLATLWIFGGSGQGWYATNETVPVDSAGRSIARLRLTTREDYLTKKWDLYLNSQMIAADVAFADVSATALTDFSVNGHTTAASTFDSFYAGPENPLLVDTNHNGLDDAWETSHGLSLATDNRQLSPVGNGVTILQSYLAGTDPNDFYCGDVPAITILVGGSSQPGTDGLLQVRLTRSDGQTIANAPVTFSISAGGSQLAASAEATLVSSLSLRSLSDGTASAFYRTPVGQPINGSVTVQAGSASAQLVFQAGTGSENQPPVVALTAPLNGAALDGAFGIVLAASAYDPEDLISKVEFIVDEIKVGESATAPYYFYWDSANFGSHTIVARATDNLGLTASSSAISVTYNPITPAFIAHDFELSEGFAIGLLSGQNGWRASPDGVLVTNETARSGTQSMVILPTPETFNGTYMAELDLGRPATANAVRFIDFWIQAVSDGTVGTSSFIVLAAGPRIGFVRNGATAELQCYWQDEGTENQWFSGISVPLDANGVTSDWHRITVREDFSAYKLDVYLDGQLALADLYYYPGDDRVSFIGHPDATTRIDNFRVLKESPLFVDTDSDGMADTWEAAHGLNPSVNDHYVDSDHDGVSNFQEYRQGTPVANAMDTDNNGLPDRWEMQNFGHIGIDPESDEDGDGVSNWIEEYFGINPKQGDTDRDGLEDGQELALGTDPANPNSKAPWAVSWLSRTNTTTTTTTLPQMIQYGLRGINVDSPNYYSQFEWTMTRTGSNADRAYHYREDFLPVSLQWKITKDFEGWPYHNGYNLNPFAPEGESYSVKGLHWTGGAGEQGTNSFRDLIVSLAVFYGWAPGSDTSMAWTQPGYDAGINGQPQEYIDEFRIELSNRIDPMVLVPGSTNTNTYQSGWSTTPPTASVGANSTATSEYNILVPEGMSGTIRWFEIFTPANDPDNKVYTARSWTIDGTKRPTATLTTNGAGSTTVLLYDAQLAVDANRDGTIKLASEDDSDATTAEKPYRFWINDDDDGIVDSSVHIPLFSYTEIEENDIDVEKSHAPDSLNIDIDGKRDLEDLARLRIAIGELRSLVHVGEVQDGEIKLGLKWKIAPDTPAEQRTPSIRLFISPDALGTNRYLFDEETAAAQIMIDGAARFGRAVGTVDANEVRPFILPDVLFTFAAPDIQLLFEGVTQGRGELHLVVLKRNQSTFEEIGQGPSVHLELKRANQICHRWTCGDGDSTPPEVLRPDLGFAWLPASASALPDEERDLVLYVHGYNMSEYLKKRWIETTYKRLWHLGYKGHVGGFTWPTAQSAEQFANSEIIAWQSAAKLNELLVDLKNRGYRVHMLGHSLGNVVCAEALHLWRAEGHTDALVRTYIASQAAIPAAVYNPFAQTMPDVEKIPYTGLPRATLPPDVYARYWKTGDSNRLPETWANSNQSYSAKAFIQSTANRWVNFYNRNDYALSGFWEVGNRLKPAKLANFVTGSLTNQYDYTSETGFAEELGIIVPSLPPLWVPLSSDPLAFPVDRYEIFTFAAPAWSLALGTIDTEGAFTSSTNLASAPYGFGSEHLWHSGQFRSYYAVRWRFWNQLLIASQLKSPE